MTCSLNDCSKPVFRRGWCSAHYYRWLRNGDPLGGRKTYPQSRVEWLNAHRNYIGDDCLVWPYSRNSHGYCIARFPGRKDIGAHRYMCELAHGNPPTPKHEAAHTCGNGSGGCLNPTHLRWETRAENEADKITHGTHNRGARHGNSKLTEEDVVKIRSLNGKMLQREIAKNYGISRSLVGMILKGERWNWLGDNQNTEPERLRASIGRA